MGYRVSSNWSDLNELKCLLAFKRLQEQGFPRGKQKEYSRMLSNETGIPINSINAKIGNYKSVAGITEPSNASEATVRLYREYRDLSIQELEKLIFKMEDSSSRHAINCHKKQLSQSSTLSRPTMSIRKRIIDKAFEVLEKHPKGVRYYDLAREIQKSDDNIKENTIHGNIWNIHDKFANKVYKPSRGLFRLTKFRDPDSDQLKDELISKQPKRIKEEEFYEPFADWLVNDIEECTKAIPLGGNRFRDKWGTPDVIGKRESKRSDIIQAPVEIVSAEIKPDINQLVTAFGQACAYCLFSHKSYLVVSNRSPDDEIARLDSLCQVFGIGLVLFDSGSPKDPKFEIRARARYQIPDLFYANRYMKHIETELFDNA